MATVDGSLSVEKPSNVSKETNNEGRETSADINNIQDGGHVSSSVVPSLLQQNSLGIFVPTPSLPPVGKSNNFPFIIVSEAKEIELVLQPAICGERMISQACSLYVVSSAHLPQWWLIVITMQKKLILLWYVITNSYI